MLYIPISLLSLLKMKYAKRHYSFYFVLGELYARYE